MAKKILISYANKDFEKSQKELSKSALNLGNFDKVIEYSPESIDKKFFEKNKKILKKIRESGY